MLDLITLGLGSFLLSSTITYAWWCKVRVIFLREDLFALRDSLWDEAKRLNAFEDQAYKAARSDLNACIQSAGMISLPLLIRVIISTPRRESVRLVSDNPELQRLIDAAYSKANQRLYRYLIFDRPFSGMMYLGMYGTGLAVKDVIGAWFDACGPKIMSSSEHRTQLQSC